MTIILQGLTMDEFKAEMSAMLDAKMQQFVAVNMPDRLLTGKDAAKELGVCYNTFKGLVSDGKITPIINGGAPKYSLKQLITLK